MNSNIGISQHCGVPAADENAEEVALLRSKYYTFLPALNFKQNADSRATAQSDNKNQIKDKELSVPKSINNSELRCDTDNLSNTDNTCSIDEVVDTHNKEQSKRDISFTSLLNLWNQPLHAAKTDFKKRHSLSQLEIHGSDKNRDRGYSFHAIPLKDSDHIGCYEDPNASAARKCSIERNKCINEHQTFQSEASLFIDPTKRVSASTNGCVEKENTEARFSQGKIDVNNNNKTLLDEQDTPSFLRGLPRRYQRGKSENDLMRGDRQQSSSLNYTHESQRDEPKHPSLLTGAHNYAAFANENSAHSQLYTRSHSIDQSPTTSSQPNSSTLNSNVPGSEFYFPQRENVPFENVIAEPRKTSLNQTDASHYHPEEFGETKVEEEVSMSPLELSSSPDMIVDKLLNFPMPTKSFEKRQQAQSLEELLASCSVPQQPWISHKFLDSKEKLAEGEKWNPPKREQSNHGTAINTPANIQIKALDRTLAKGAADEDVLKSEQKSPRHSWVGVRNLMKAFSVDVSKHVRPSRTNMSDEYNSSKNRPNPSYRNSASDLRSSANFPANSPLSPPYTSSSQEVLSASPGLQEFPTQHIINSSAQSYAIGNSTHLTPIFALFKKVNSKNCHDEALFDHAPIPVDSTRYWDSRVGNLTKEQAQQASSTIARLRRNLTTDPAANVWNKLPAASSSHNQSWLQQELDMLVLQNLNYIPDGFRAEVLKDTEKYNMRQPRTNMSDENNSSKNRPNQFYRNSASDLTSSANFHANSPLSPTYTSSSQEVLFPGSYVSQKPQAPQEAKREFPGAGDGHTYIASNDCQLHMPDYSDYPLMRPKEGPRRYSLEVAMFDPLQKRNDISEEIDETDNSLRHHSSSPRDDRPKRQRDGPEEATGKLWEMNEELATLFDSPRSNSSNISVSSSSHAKKQTSLSDNAISLHSTVTTHSNNSVESVAYVKKQMPHSDPTSLAHSPTTTGSQVQNFIDSALSASPGLQEFPIQQIINSNAQSYVNGNSTHSTPKSALFKKVSSKNIHKGTLFDHAPTPVDSTQYWDSRVGNLTKEQVQQASTTIARLRIKLTTDPAANVWNKLPATSSSHNQSWLQQELDMLVLENLNYIPDGFRAQLLKDMEHY